MHFIGAWKKFNNKQDLYREISWLNMNKKLSFESRLTWLSLSASVPLLLLLIFTMIYADISVYLILLTVFLGLILVIISNALIHQKSAYQFRSLSNLLDAMTKGDYAMRIRQEEKDSALNELVTSINGLAQHLSNQRIQSIENQLLLNTVIEHIDVAIVSLDADCAYQTLNPAAENLLLSHNAEQRNIVKQQVLALSSIKPGRSSVMDLHFAHQNGRFNIHSEQYRSSGQQHQLIFITDVSHILRKEEEKAWKNLVRVLSHEINNSLTPIASISQTLEKISKKSSNLSEHSDDLQAGLQLIAERSRALRDFVNSYRELNQLPLPDKKPTDLLQMSNKLVQLFGEKKLLVKNKDKLIISGDPIQIEQVLINLIKNGIEACKLLSKDEPVARIELRWLKNTKWIDILISDNGNGIKNVDNLFVPFYTTKAKGSGIGLALSRQIIEAHSGKLLLANRTDQSGCVATIRLPNE